MKKIFILVAAKIEKQSFTSIAEEISGCCREMGFDATIGSLDRKGEITKVVSARKVGMIILEKELEPDHFYSDMKSLSSATKIVQVKKIVIDSDFFQSFNEALKNVTLILEEEK